MTSLKLSNSPKLSEVAARLREFNQANGPADVYYYGAVADDAGAHSFRNALHVSRLFPYTGYLALTLHDHWHSWTVMPDGKYAFEIVRRGEQPSRSVEKVDIAQVWPDFAAELAPYAAAAKAEQLDDILRLLDFRAPIAVQGAASLRRLFPPKRRGGIYVLHFANGQYYVGQSVDVLHRLRQHQKRHADIQAISFRRLGRKRLDFHEAELIRLLERKGFVLRNISMASVLSEEPASFDTLMPTETQARWLADMSYVDIDGDRPSLRARNETLRLRCREFRDAPDYLAVMRVLRAYVRSALPAIKRAESAYWQLSCLPSGYGVLARINVNWQEVFFADRDDIGLYFYLCLSKMRLQPIFGEDLAGLTDRYPDIEWEDGLYRAGGGDQITVDIWGAETAQRFVTDPDIVPALRHYNLRLMKKGKCPWGKSHNFELVDAIVADDWVA